LRSVPGWYENRAKELEGLFGPYRTAYGPSLSKELVFNDELRKEIHERFEQRKACGEFPALSEYFDNLSLKEREQFFRTEGRGALPAIVLDSDEGDRIIRFKQGLVLDLFLRRGEFWNEIRSIRDRWDVEALAKSPSSVPWMFRPQRDAGRNKDAYEYELSELRQRVIPKRYSEAIADWEVPGHWGNNWVNWERFIALCVMHDPPETDLIRFAEYAGPYPTATPIIMPEDPEKRAVMEGRLHPFRMVAPPIRYLKDPDEVFQAESWLRHALIRKVAENLGITAHYLEYLFDRARDDPEIREGYVSRWPEQDLYIQVNEWTTEKDVRNAFRLIRQTQLRHQEGGAPKRSQLLAVQCAVLYDRHNSADPADKRRRKWSYERLAQEFGLSSARAAKQYVIEGREIFGEK